MARYTEGERLIRHLQKYGEYPPPPRQYRKQQTDMGNHVSDIVGTWYRGEREPRALQRPPVYFPKKPIRETIPAAALYGNDNQGVRWDLIVLGAMALLVIGGALGYVRG